VSSLDLNCNACIAALTRLLLTMATTTTTTCAPIARASWDTVNSANTNTSNCDDSSCARRRLVRFISFRLVSFRFAVRCSLIRFAQSLHHYHVSISTNQPTRYWFQQTSYDVPKIIDAILRLRLIGRGIPVLRFDQDVIFPAHADPAGLVDFAAANARVSESVRRAVLA
jgi:hypothetical protein